MEVKITQMDAQAKVVHQCYEKNQKSAYDAALELEELSEKTVLLTRLLPAYTGNPSAGKEVEQLILDQVPVEIGFTAEGWFCVRMGTLLPKKESGSVDYLRAFLYPAMRTFFSGKAPVRYRDCVLIFRHVYDRMRPERRKRDHDNIEVNLVSDIVALYVLPDDNPSVCSHYYCSASSDEDRTEVYVVPKRDFLLWLADERAIPNKGVKLYENIFIRQ